MWFCECLGTLLTRNGRNIYPWSIPFNNSCLEVYGLPTFTFCYLLIVCDVSDQNRIAWSSSFKSSCERQSKAFNWSVNKVPKSWSTLLDNFSITVTRLLWIVTLTNTTLKFRENIVRIYFSYKFISLEVNTLISVNCPLVFLFIYFL